jgi:ACR3 family arsenite efflux pump ArsB
MQEIVAKDDIGLGRDINRCIKQRDSGIREYGSSMRKVIANSLVVALGAILLCIFVLFWVEGSLIIQEPNKLVLGAETLMAFSIIVFGIERLIHS